MTTEFLDRTAASAAVPSQLAQKLFAKASSKRFASLSGIDRPMSQRGWR
jgi:hypothetical protein